jgi:oligosaccharide repeat unit polymerase
MINKEYKNVYIEITSLIISPSFILLSIWSLQFFGYFFLEEQFDPINNYTWIIVLVGIVSFLFGALFCSLLFPVKIAYNYDPINYDAIKLSYYIFLPIYIVFAFIPSLNIFISGGSLEGIREMLITNTIERDVTTVYSTYLNYLAVLYSIYIINYSNGYSKTFLYFVFLVGLFAGISTLGRSIILLMIIACIISLFIQKKISFKIIIIICIILLISFLGFALLLNKGGQNSIWENLIWNFNTYIFSGLSCFNYYVVYNEPYFEDGLLLPNFIRILLENFNFNLEKSPTFLPFIQIPSDSNVYTIFYPWYHDLGILGVVMSFFLMGNIFQYLFNRRYSSLICRYFYSLSVYSIIMSIFDEQIIRAYPLWILSILIPVSVGIFSLMYSQKKVKL